MADDPNTDHPAGARADSPFDDAVLRVSGGTIVAADAAAGDLFDCDRRRLAGVSLSELCPDAGVVYGPDELAAAVEWSLAHATTFEWVFETATGGEVTTEVAARPASGDDADVSLYLRGTPSRTHVDWDVHPVERLHYVAARLEECSSPEEVYGLAVEAGAEILGFDAAAIAVASGDRLVTTASVSDVGADVFESVPLGYGLAGETFRTGETARVDRVEDEADAAPFREGYVSALCVPVGEYGIYQVVSRDPGAFTPRDRELAELLAGHAADAVRHVRNEAALREERRKTAALHDVADEMMASDRESRVFELAVETAESILEFDRCLVLSAAEDRFVPVAASAEVAATGDVELALEEGVAGEVWRTGESRVLKNVVLDETAVPQLDAIASGLAVPIGDVGVFQAFSSTVEAFDDRDVELAELLAAHVATSVERIRSARALERQRTEFVSLVEDLPGMVFQTEPGDASRLAFASDFATQLAGYDPEELTDGGLTFDALVDPDDRETVAERRRSALESGTSYEETYRLLTADGGERWVREHATGLFGEGEGEATLEGIVTDVTGTHRRAQLKVLNRFLRHNLRNDVQVIDGHAEKLAGGVTDEDLAASVGRIRDAARKLIDHSKKAGTMESLLGRDQVPTGTPLDLAAIVRRRVEEVRRASPGAEVHVEAPERCRVQAVPLLEAAVAEALDNAVRHAEGTPRIEVAIGHAGEDRVTLTVADDGPGIPPQDRAALEDRTETPLSHGSGLGLWLIRWVVTASRGELEVGDAPGGGTELRVTLALADET